MFNPDEMPEWLSTLLLHKANPNLIAGVNEDDCGVIQLGSTLVVLTTDFLNARPIALELGIGTPWDLGRLVVAASLSDLCGSGAKPEALLIAVMLERNTNRAFFEDLMRGAKHESERHNIEIIGGDTKLGDSTSILGVGVGSAQKQSHLFLKNRGKAGDIVWVSGNIGSTSAAVTGLSTGFGDETWKKWAHSAILSPKLPISKSMSLSKAELGNGGTDISDGLGVDLSNLCKASKVGAIIDVDKLPISAEVKLLAHQQGIPAWAFAFTIGGDFQFIVSTNDTEEIRDTLGKIDFYPIGRLTEKKEILMKIGDQKFPLPDIGHLDSRSMNFSDEVRYLLQEIPVLQG